MPNHLSLYAIPQQSRHYQAAEWWLKAQMVGALKDPDPLTWRVMCLIDNRRSVRSIMAFLPREIAPSERLAVIERALYRLIVKHQLVSSQMKEEQRATVSPWPSPRPAPQALPTPIRRPAPRAQRKPQQRPRKRWLPVLLSRSRAALGTLAHSTRAVWAWRQPARTWLSGAGRGLVRLIRGWKPQARAPFAADYRVPQRPTPVQPAYEWGMRPVRLRKRRLITKHIRAVAGDWQEKKAA